MSDFRLSAVLELRDNLSGRLRNAVRGMQSMSSGAGAASSAIDRAVSSMDRGARSASNLQRNLSGMRGTYRPTIEVRDNATSRLHQVRSELNSIQGSHNASVGIRDMASARIHQIRGELQSLTGKAYDAVVNIKQNATAPGGPASKFMSGASGVASGMLMNTGVQMMGTAGIGYGIYDTVNTYKEFEKQMAAVKAISTSDMGADEANAAMDRLTKKAREMGAATQFSATEAAKAFEYMGMAGWSTEQMISGIPAVLNLALASGEDLASVSDIVTDAMTALKIDTRGADADRNIQHFTDVLAAAATKSNTTVGMMGEAFKYAAAPAGLLTQSYDNAADISNDIALALGLMANSGIKASQAGTALRSTLTRMTADTIPTANAMRMLGVDITQVGKDGTEQLKPLRSIFDDLRAKMKEGVSTESLVNYAEALSGTKTRNKEALMEFAGKLANQGGKLSAKDQAKFAKMFAGEEALSGWLAVMTATDEDYQKLINAVDNSEGMAAKQAATRADTLAGDFDKLKSAWDDLQIEFMQGPSADGLREFLQGIQSDINKFKGYLEDGFDISDVGKIALDILTQLKDKFLEMDGVGSVLAGGALIGVLYKIGSKAKSVAETIKDLATRIPGGTGGVPTPGGRAGGLPGGLPEIPSVNNMVVNARSVVVNGATGGAGGTGGGGGPEIGDIDLSSDNDNRGRGRNDRRRRLNRASGRGYRVDPSSVSRGADLGGAAPAARAGSSAGVSKWMGRLGVPLAVAMGAWDIYNVSEENDALAAEAKERVDAARSAAMSGMANLGTSGVAGENTGNDAAFQSALQDLKEAEENQKAVENENLDRMGETVGGTGGGLAGSILGAKAGAAIGTFVGGPVGTAIGGIVGGIGGAIAGSELGAAIGGQLSVVKEAASETWESVKAGASNTAQWVSNNFGDMKNAAQNEWDYLTNSASKMSLQVRSRFEDLAIRAGEKFFEIKDAAANEWNYIANTAGGMAQGIRDKLGGIASWVDGNVWTPVKDAGITAINFLVGAGAILGSAIGDALSPVVAYLSDNVWMPIKDTATEKWNALWAGISEGWETAKTGFAEVASWFDASVWTPVKEMASLAWSEIASLPGIAIESMTALWGEASAFLDASVWQPISAMASAAWNTVSMSAGMAWDGIVSCFGQAASWFDGTVWQPISSAVGGVKSAIVGAFEAAWSAVTGIWSAAASWFESNVIAPVKAAFSKIAAIGSSITGLATSGGIPGHASGTSWTAGGWTEVNEHGGEIIDLPTGARVYPHATTMGILQDEARKHFESAFPAQEPAPSLIPLFAGMAESGMPGTGLAISGAASLAGSIQNSFQQLLQMFRPQGETGIVNQSPSQMLQETSAPASPDPSVQGSRGPVTVTIQVENMNVREVEDIDRIAYRLQQLLSEAASNYNFVEEGI